MSNRLPILQDEIVGLHNAVRRHVKSAAENALAAGAALVEAKSLCSHGEWAIWLKNTGIPERSAQRYMKLHNSGCNSAIVADLGIAKSERLASLGLNLWPDRDKGRELAGGNLDGSFVYAVILPQDDLAVYWSAYQFPAKPEQDFYLFKRCGSPFVLGILHDHLSASFMAFTSKVMTQTETREAWADLEVAA